MIKSIARKAKGAVFLCVLAGLMMAACSPSPSVNLELDSEVLALALDTKKLPVNIEENSQEDIISLYYKDLQTRPKVVDFFSALTKSKPVALAILESACKHRVPASLAFAIAYEESRFNPKALGKNPGSVDRGLFQLNSITFPEMSETQAFDPEYNASEGMKYFRHVLDISGNEVAALAMYNAGRTRVSQKGAPVKTLDYISRVQTYEENIASLFTAKVVAQKGLVGRVRLGLAAGRAD
ncbi:MAG TPA: transglycosylase SLT domain-containing protein [Rectinemataceae bacterium]